MNPADQSAATPAGATASYIDTHAHLDLPEFAGDRHEVIQRALHNGIERIITIGIGIEECRQAKAIADSYPAVYAALGIHPHNAAALDMAVLDFLETSARHPKVVAIGEIGLDFFRNRSPRPAQVRAFRAQLDLAQSLKLPVIIHDRDAHGETLAMLREEQAGLCGGVLHCFSGDAAMAVHCIDLGFYISIPGTVTFKQALLVQEVVSKVPLEHLLIETDCPFLAPVPHRGQRNEPLYVKLVAQQIARIKHEAVEHVAQVTTSNARKLFRLT